MRVNSGRETVHFNDCRLNFHAITQFIITDIWIGVNGRRGRELHSFEFNRCFIRNEINLLHGELIKYCSIDSTVGFVYNVVTSSGT